MQTVVQHRRDPKVDLLDAAKRVLVAEGYAGLSTRAVATEAGTQMIQIRYGPVA